MQIEVEKVSLDDVRDRITERTVHEQGEVRHNPPSDAPKTPEGNLHTQDIAEDPKPAATDTLAVPEESKQTNPSPRLCTVREVDESKEQSWTSKPRDSTKALPSASPAPRDAPGTLNFKALQQQKEQKLRRAQTKKKPEEDASFTYKRTGSMSRKQTASKCPAVSAFGSHQDISFSSLEAGWAELLPRGRSSENNNGRYVGSLMKSIQKEEEEGPPSIGDRIADCDPEGSFREGEDFPFDSEWKCNII